MDSSDEEEGTVIVILKWLWLWHVFGKREKNVTKNLYGPFSHPILMRVLVDSKDVGLVSSLLLCAEVSVRYWCERAL